MSAADKIRTWAEKYQVSIETRFVPWSVSRSRHDKDQRGRPRYSLNWFVDLKMGGRPIHTREGLKAWMVEKGIDSVDEDYYLRGRPTEPYVARLVLSTEYTAGSGYCRAEDPQGIQDECETGKGTPKLDIAQVLASLALDASVLDSGSFESWARDLGYDPDSRKAEAIYRACIDHAVYLKRALGIHGLRELREAAEDY